MNNGSNNHGCPKGLRFSRRSFLILLAESCLAFAGSPAFAGQRSVTTQDGQTVLLDQPHPRYWSSFAERLLCSMASGKTKLAASFDKDFPIRRTSPLNPGRTINGASRPHYGTDYSARDPQGTLHSAKCLYSPFDAVVVEAGNMFDGRGEYSILQSTQQDASFGMIVSHFHMSSQFAPMAGRCDDGKIEYHAGVKVKRGQCIGLVGDTGWTKNGTKVSTGIHDDIRGYESLDAYRAKQYIDFHPINILAWELSKPTDYKVLQGKYAHNVDKEFAMEFFASLPKTPAILKTALGGASETVMEWYREYLALTGGR